MQARPAPVRNPILPADKADRTGSAGIRRRAAAEIRRRFEGLRRDVLAIFDGIRTLAVNDAAAQMARTVYQLTPEELAQVAAELGKALERWIAGGRETASLFWWAPFDAEAAQAGTAQSVANLTALSPVYAAATSLQQVIFSEAYRTRVGVAQLKSYEHWTGLAAESRATLAQIIGRAVVDGKNPRAVRAEIAEALGVSKARALSYAQTDITDTLRQARWAEAERASQQFGLAIGLLWTSALVPTTRQSHAAKHGKVLTNAEVKEFYSKNGNRYNCRCAQTECLLDENSTPRLTDALKSAMLKEKQNWQNEAVQ